jgi:hypothetical protein
MNDISDRDAVVRAAQHYDEIKERTQQLQRELDRAHAHLKAQQVLVDELRLALDHERNNCAAYRAEAEQARSDTTAWRTFFASVQSMFIDFDIPRHDLPMKDGNGKTLSKAEQVPALDDDVRHVGKIELWKAHADEDHE